MANKYQLITKLYRTMLVSVTEMPQSQKAFLRSACNNYKCPFDEQVLICAQKLDATAVFEMEKWNRLLKLPLPKVLKTTSGHLPKRNPFRRQCYRQGKTLQQTTFKETSVQPQSECDNNRRRQWEQVAKRGQVGFLWAFCRLQEIYIYWRFHFNQQKNKTMYVIAESGDTGLLLYKNIGKGKSLSMEGFPVLMFRED